MERLLRGSQLMLHLFAGTLHSEFQEGLLLQLRFCIAALLEQPQAAHDLPLLH